MNGVRCPGDPDETAEAYLLGRLSQQQHEAFEDHFISCPLCTERLQLTEDFIKAVAPTPPRDCKAELQLPALSWRLPVRAGGT
jgi:hypothetical protein